MFIDDKLSFSFLKIELSKLFSLSEWIEEEEEGCWAIAKWKLGFG
jgi:hypothetical protein